MNIEERIISIVKDNIEYKNRKCEISLSTRLIEDLNIDSFDKLMIINAIEDEFSLNVNEEDFKDIAVVSDIVDKLKDKYPDIERT